MTTSVEETIEFLGIAASKGFLNNNTVQSRLTACDKFFDILDPDQKNVEYVRDNLDVIKSRFSNLNKDVAGTTVDEYGRRVKLVLDDFAAWKDDCAGWERSVSAKQAARSAGDNEKKAKPKAEKKAQQTENLGQATNNRDFADDATMRVLEFPLRKDVEVKISLPRDGITMAELKKIAWFLLPYATDFDPGVSPRETFTMLEGNDIRAH